MNLISDDILLFFKYKKIVNFINLNLDINLKLIININYNYTIENLKNLIPIKYNNNKIKNLLLSNKFKYEQKILNINKILKKLVINISENECPICFDMIIYRSYYIILKCCKYIICNNCYIKRYFYNNNLIHNKCMFCQRIINKIDDIILMKNNNEIINYNNLSITKLSNIKIYKKIIETKSIINIINYIIHDNNILLLLRTNINDLYYNTLLNNDIYINGETNLNLLYNNLNNIPFINNKNKIIIISVDYMKLCFIFEKIQLLNSNLITSIICKYNNNNKQNKDTINNFINNVNYKCIFIYNINYNMNIIYNILNYITDIIFIDNIDLNQNNILLNLLIKFKNINKKINIHLLNQ